MRGRDAAGGRRAEGNESAREAATRRVVGLGDDPGEGVGHGRMRLGPSGARSTAAARWPPKPSESFKAARIGSMRPTRGVPSRSQAGSGSRRLRVGGSQAVPDRQAGDRQFRRTRRAEQVADLGLIGRAGDPIGLLAEGQTNRPAFQGVIGTGGRAVDVDVVDLLRADPRILQRATDQAGEVGGVGVQVGHVVGIGADGPARDLRIRPRTPWPACGPRAPGRRSPRLPRPGTPSVLDPRDAWRRRDRPRRAPGPSSCGRPPARSAPATRRWRPRRRHRKPPDGSGRRLAARR